MEFHIARAARERYGVDDLLFSYTGNVVFANIAASRELANRVNEVRETSTSSADVFHAASLFAMGLIDELSHALIAEYREALDPAVLPDAIKWFAGKLDQGTVEELLSSFVQQFPNISIYRGVESVEQWLDRTVEGMSNREAAFEELLLLWLSNINPAFAPFKEFFDDEQLVRTTVYKDVTKQLDTYFESRPLFDPAVGTLLDALRAPMLASPDSLTGQLDFIREKWVEHLGQDVRRVLLAMDMVKEEEIAVWMQFHPPSASARHPERKQGWGSEGFVGDEYIGFGEETVLQRQLRLHGRVQEPTINEYEAFSPDQAWMPTVVLIAKSTYVWLEQLSKKYLRHIYRLDQIPDEELSLLADRGLNGLWLIGLWERSAASQTIKRLRGQADAVASAYSLRDYRIAEDLGGEAAYQNLRDRAAAKGIRLASDMVPNHMGIDSTWVMEHPEWFISRPESPFPVYRFEGPDLSTHSRYEIKIEDHYFDQTDAAVVFRLRERNSGHTEFVYHGNDGTTFAWNDTAQLDYSKAVVREQVMQTILAVARLFPIIRFDAAMTLAKKHVQRLWFPLPGVGGSIPSRAESSLTNEEFDALMPHEFWREVVDRVAIEVPGTLLLAEAFWLLEGYFVRTLGMHRVYNSAFMNMLRDEENAKYRSYLKKTIEFDPDILKRYVNFMSNPDERTAIDQFGSGDRYFGVCTVLATIPGLPMFSHGQVEGFNEKYGMEYKRARFEEYPNEDLVARHQREIAPLLKNRKLFAESVNFVLYDFWTPDGTVDENVFVYSNRLEEERAIIFFNNRYGDTSGTIHISAESMDKASGTLRSRRLAEALNLRADDSLVVAYTDTVTGLQYLRRSNSLDHNGLSVELHAYQYIVLQNWRELRSTAEQPWDRLCDALNGAGTSNIDEALSRLRLWPLHDSLRQLLHPSIVQAVVDEILALPLPTAPIDLAFEIEDLEGPADKREADGVAISDTAKKKSAAQNGLPLPLPESSPQISVHSDVTDKSNHEQFIPFLEKARGFISNVKSLNQILGSLDEEQVIKATHQTLNSMKNLTNARSALVKLGSAAMVLPIGPDKAKSVSLWAPVLFSSLLQHLQSEAIVGTVLFDDLQLRSALAEAFSSLGIGGQDRWRAASRVRVLLAHNCGASLTALKPLISSSLFWNDPDVRWLAGVGEYEGHTYLNKEAFQELTSWLMLPALLEGQHDEVAAALQEVFLIAENSKYEVSKFRTSLLQKEAQPEKIPPILTSKEIPASQKSIPEVTAPHKAGR